MQLQSFIAKALSSLKQILPHNSQQALRDSEERFRLISSMTSDYTFSSRFDGHGGLEHYVYGGAFETITGYTPDEFVKMGGWAAIVHPDDRPHP